jgi:lipoyl-dependent peroxiredoxin subunit D
MPASDNLHSTRDEARAQELLGQVERSLGHIPQVYRTLALNQTFLTDTLFNLRNNMVEGVLDLKTKHLIAVAVASVAGGPNIVEARTHEARNAGLSDDQIGEALTVAASITTHNVFYKFQHLAGDHYDDFRPGYKLSVFLRPMFITRQQLELICAIISGLNDCQSCVRGHLAKCRELGVTIDQVEEALRVSALIAGFATFTKVE